MSVVDHDERVRLALVHAHHVRHDDVGGVDGGDEVRRHRVEAVSDVGEDLVEGDECVGAHRTQLLRAHH